MSLQRSEPVSQRIRTRTFLLHSTNRPSRSVTSISLRDYTLALVGMVPATLAYVFLGSTAGSLAQGGGASPSPTERAVRISLYVLGALSLVVAVSLLSRHARKELRRLAPAAANDQAADEEEEEEGGGGEEAGIKEQEEGESLPAGRGEEGRWDAAAATAAATV